ncbi:MAG: hypothetical protein CXT64_02635 [Methanobacteriota archaeon]|nr:MAG: hypothetical protein CXT64_02635 [Euryarchaeota archaeon]
MSGESDVDKFQRWLQNRLATLEINNDSGDHERAMIRIQNAIHEVISFRESIETHSEVEDPFVKMLSRGINRILSVHPVVQICRVIWNSARCAANSGERFGSQ